MECCRPDAGIDQARAAAKKCDGRVRGAVDELRVTLSAPAAIPLAIVQGHMESVWLDPTHAPSV